MIAGVALMLSAGPVAAANGFLSGKIFLEKCGAVPLLKNGTFDEKGGQEILELEAGAFQAGYCLGYVNGVYHRASMEGAHGRGPDYVCSRATGHGEPFLIIIKYLKENPTELYHPASLLLEEALREAWPCPK
jgi:hypothetical protein